jgi:hypothetical protein
MKINFCPPVLVTNPAARRYNSTIHFPTLNRQRSTQLSLSKHQLNWSNNAPFPKAGPWRWEDEHKQETISWETLHRTGKLNTKSWKGKERHSRKVRVLEKTVLKKHWSLFTALTRSLKLQNWVMSTWLWFRRKWMANIIEEEIEETISSCFR